MTAQDESATGNANDTQHASEEAVYQRALELQSHADSYEDQKQALDLFQSIYFYKDADRHANQCTFRAWEIRWDKRKRVAKRVVPALLAIAVVACVAYAAHDNAQRAQSQQRALAYKYSQAVQLAEQGEYAKAIEGFTALGDYEDAAQQAQAVRERAEQDQIDAVSGAQAGDKVAFGFFNDGGSARNELLWRVLAEDGDRLLLVTNTNVTNMPFNAEEDDVRWQTSTLRAWLNGDFPEGTFTARQRSMIELSDVACDDGETVQDACFVLSVDEARNLFAPSEDWAINEDRSTTNNWWLRSSSTDDRHVDACWMNGSLYLDGYTPTSECGVRVAMWVHRP